MKTFIFTSPYCIIWWSAIIRAPSHKIILNNKGTDYSSVSETGSGKFPSWEQSHEQSEGPEFRFWGLARAGSMLAGVDVSGFFLSFFLGWEELLVCAETARCVTVVRP